MENDHDNHSSDSTDEGNGTNEENGSSSDNSLGFPDLPSVYTSDDLTSTFGSLAVPALPKYKTIETLVPLSYLPGGRTSTKIHLKLSPKDIEYVSLTRINHDDKTIYPTAMIVRMFSLFGDTVVSNRPKMVKVWVNDKVVVEDDAKWWISDEIKLCPHINNAIELLWCNSMTKDYLITVEIVKKMQKTMNLTSGPIQYEVIDLTRDDD